MAAASPPPSLVLGAARHRVWKPLHPLASHLTSNYSSPASSEGAQYPEEPGGLMWAWLCLCILSSVRCDNSEWPGASSPGGWAGVGRAEEEAQARDRVLGNPGSAVTRGCDHVLPGVRTGGGLDMRSVYMHVVVCICGFLCCVGHSVWPRGCMDSVSSLRAHTRDIQCACASTCGVCVERAGSVWSGVGMWMRAVVCMRPCKREGVHHTHPG